MVDEETFNRFIEDVERVPATPSLLLKLVPLVKDPEVFVDDIVKLVSLDPGLSADLLKTVNSARFAGREPSKTVHCAISRLGVAESYRVLSLVVCRALYEPAHGEQEPDLAKTRWKHAVATGIGASHFFEMTGQDGMEGFVAGLLHDLGKVALGEAFGDIYTCLSKRSREEGRSLISTEIELLGFSHAHAGAKLLTRWGLSSECIRAVANHHSEHLTQADTLAAAVILGDSTAHFLGYADERSLLDLRLMSVAFEILGLNRKSLRESIPIIQERVEKYDDI